MYTTFIISHNNADGMKTLDTLRSMEFNTPYYVVIDDSDKQIDRYIDLYGDNLLVFSKQHYMHTADTITMPKEECSALYVKQYIEYFCNEHEITTFIIIDDDLKGLRFRYLCEDKILSLPVDCINQVFAAYVDYMVTANLCGLCFGIHSMYMNKDYKPHSRRQFTNIYFRNGKIKFNWVSQIYDDLNSCLWCADSDSVILMLPFVQMDFEPQYFQIQNKGSDKFKIGGLVDLYNNNDSFRRAFVSTIIKPSGVRPYLNKQVWMMRTDTDKTFPKIISSMFKK